MDLLKDLLDEPSLKSIVINSLFQLNVANKSKNRINPESKDLKL